MLDYNKIVHSVITRQDIKYISLVQYYLNSINNAKILFFFKIIIKKKRPSVNVKGLSIVWLPRQDDFRNFCMSDETGKLYQKLEETINI